MLDQSQANYIGFMYNSCHPKPVCPSPPYQLFIESTNICNLKCEFCIQHTMNRRRGMMKIETFKQIIDSIKECYGFIPLIDLSGQGEPLLVKHIDQMVKYAKDQGCNSVRVQTNGNFLTEDLSRRLVEAGLDKINISFGSHIKSVYDKVQPGGDFEKTLKQIVKFLELKKEYGKMDLEVVISTVEYDEFVDTMDGFLDQFSRLPFNRVKINKFHPWLWTHDNPHRVKMEETPKEEWKVCKNPWRILSFKWNGVAMACNDDWEDHYTLGNISDFSVEEIWNGKRMQNFRNAHIEKKFECIGPLDKNMCLSCGGMFDNCHENGSTYPPDFQTGLKEMMAHTHTGGRSDREIYSDEEDIINKYEFLDTNKEQWLKAILD